MKSNTKKVLSGDYNDYSYTFKISEDIKKHFDLDIEDDILKLKKTLFCKRVTKSLYKEQTQVDTIMEQQLFYISPAVESFDPTGGIVYTVPVKFGNYPNKYFEEYVQYCIWLNGNRLFFGVITQGEAVRNVINTESSYWWADVMGHMKKEPTIKARNTQELIDWEFEITPGFYDNIIEQDFFIQSVRHIHTRTMYYLQKEINLMDEYINFMPA